MSLIPNPSKNLIIETGNKKYARYPVKTHIVTPKDDISEVVVRYAKEHLKSGDVVFIGERSVAISQGRTYVKNEVKPCWLARFLVRFVTKSPYGIGLGSPETMQLAVEEVGVPRIILAAFFAAVTKPLGIKGVFYWVAGSQARAVDGAADYVIPPYNNHVTKAPVKPNQVAQEISEKIGVPVALVDACDIGVWVVGKSRGINEKLIIQALGDNPLGQGTEQTPLGILREIKE